MLFFLMSFFPFAVLLSKSLPMQALPPWAGEVGVISFLFWKGLISPLLHLFDKCRPIAARKVGSSPSPMSQRRGCAIMAAENAEEAQEMSILDLPELTLESILVKLTPAGLSNMAAVCTSLRERCRSDHLWEKHMEEKWGKVIGPAACRERKLHLASNSTSLLGFGINAGHWIGLLNSCVWPISWFKERIESCNRSRNPLPDGTLMSWYQSLESGKFWFPAQVYNREHAHVGFMLSCYDAQVSYDCKTDSFTARYPPHGQRIPVEEKGIEWNRLRAPPVDTCAHELHISDCLSVLRPGDHIEIQWRRSKKFPYGWWYGVIGHLEPCDGNELFCRCHLNDTVVLEFNQYTAGSRWRQTSINRNDHKEEGNETDGFYGGIRKLQGKDEISKWRELWPTDVLEE